MDGQGLDHRRAISSQSQLSKDAHCLWEKSDGLASRPSHSHSLSASSQRPLHPLLSGSHSLCSRAKGCVEAHTQQNPRPG